MGEETGWWCSVPEGRKRTSVFCPGRKYGHVCYQDMGQGRVKNWVRYAQHSFMENYIFPSKLDKNFIPKYQTGEIYRHTSSVCRWVYHTNNFFQFKYADIKSPSSESGGFINSIYKNYLSWTFTEMSHAEVSLTVKIEMIFSGARYWIKGSKQLRVPFSLASCSIGSTRAGMLSPYRTRKLHIP